MVAALTLHSLDTLPQAPASDVKKLGWRGVMKVVARSGRLVVTNHNQPEAVILPAEEYNRLLQLLRDAGEKDRAALETLRKQYDERLAVLHTPEARETLRDLLRRPLDFEGTIFTGDEF